MKDKTIDESLKVNNDVLTMGENRNVEPGVTYTTKTHHRET